MLEINHHSCRISRRFETRHASYYHPACLFASFRRVRAGTQTIQVGFIDWVNTCTLCFPHRRRLKVLDVNLENDTKGRFFILLIILGY
jgi:hypothetical protein